MSCGMPAPILALIDELDALGRTRDDAWQVPRVEGELLHQIALSCGARLIVEVGTSYGFSGLFWGAALLRTGGRLLTIDMDPRKVESSRQTFARAGLSGVIANHQGDARGVLPGVAGPIDIAFLDADKALTQAYFDLVWPKVRVGGFVLVDNASTHRRELADFVAGVRARPDAASVEVAIGNGLEWTLKLS